MRKFTMLSAFLLSILIVGSGALQAQTKISDWGAIGTRLAGSGWTLGLDGTTPAGDVSLSGTAAPGNWTAVRGGFDSDVVLTSGESFKVSGAFAINGDLDIWNPLRIGVYNHTDIGTLVNAGTDSAAWGYTQYAGTDSAAFFSNESSAFGYLVTNQTGANGGIAGQGGNGNLWAVNGGSWISTWSGGTMTLGQTIQSPRRAIMPAGTYDFEMSVEMTTDSTAEIKWYIMNQDGASYLHSGSHTETFQYAGTDSSTFKTTFNGFAFSMQNGVETVTQIDLTGFEYEMGATVTIPEPIFSSFYVSDWGAIGSRLPGSGWILDNDSTTLVGDAYLSGDVAPGNWTAVRGGFGELPVTATLEEAVIISGEFEINGDLDIWNPLRFGMFNHTDIGTLHNQYTDSAQWGYMQYEGTDSAAFFSNEASAYGYLITNQTGANGGIAGNGGNGNAWTVNGGSWISTWSGGNITMGETIQSPRRAIMPAGTYEFEMSAQPLADGTTEFRWYIMSDDGESYLHSGVHIDTVSQKTEFNGFVFSMQNGVETVTELNLYAVEVDRGAPIEIPEPIFSSFYVSDWGAIGTRLPGSGWTLDNDSTTLVGDAYISGDAAPGNWTAVRGGFGELPVKATLEEAVIISGEFEINGDLDGWNPLRFGMFNHTDIGTLHNQYTDSAQWGYMQYEGTDSAAFVSNEASAYGYLITNQVGANGGIAGNGGNGNAWTVNGGSWISTWSGGNITMGQTEQSPRRAIMPAGTYEFEMSAQPLADGTTEFRWYILSDDGETYLHSGVHVDTVSQKTEFNGFVFSMQNGIETVTEIALYAVEVDRGAPIEIPDPIFSPFYVGDWGFLGGKFGAAAGDTAWSLTPGTLVGDAEVSGSAATGWAALAGNFGIDVVPDAEEGIVVEGMVTFEDGGFEDANSFMFGLVNADLGGLDSLENAGYNFNGSENASGYLFVPSNGTDVSPTWAAGGAGSVGAVSGGAWYDAAGAGATALAAVPGTGTPGAGTYDFMIFVVPNGDGTNTVHAELVKDDDSYVYRVTAVDAAGVTDRFNAVVFATNNSSTTSMFVEAVYVNKEAMTVSKEVEKTDIPAVFALDQNYPNPFNPSTNIRFSLPQASNVTLAVYDMLGRKVATLINGEQMNAAYHTVKFDASALASGMYIYRIEAGSFVSTKKMMLIK